MTCRCEDTCMCWEKHSPKSFADLFSLWFQHKAEVCHECGEAKGECDKPGCPGKAVW